MDQKRNPNKIRAKLKLRQIAPWELQESASRAQFAKSHPWETHSPGNPAGHEGAGALLQWASSPTYPIQVPSLAKRLPVLIFDCEVFQAGPQCWGPHTPLNASRSITVVNQLIRFPPSLLMYITRLVHFSVGKGVAAPASRGPACCVESGWDWGPRTEAEGSHGALRGNRDGLGVPLLQSLSCSVFLTANVALHPGFLWRWWWWCMCLCFTWARSALEREVFQDFSLFSYKKIQYVPCTSVANIYIVIITRAITTMIGNRRLQEFVYPTKKPELKLLT